MPRLALCMTRRAEVGPFQRRAWSANATRHAAARAHLHAAVVQADLRSNEPLQYEASRHSVKRAAMT